MSKKKNTAELTPISSIQQQLETVKEQLAKDHKTSNEALKNYEDLAKAWDERHTVMVKILEMSTIESYQVTEDVAVTLKAFHEQASRYKMTYETLLENEKDLNKQISESLADIDSKILQITSIDRFSSLDQKLQELTAGTNIVHDSVGTIDGWTIRKIVFTAQALIDLNKERTLV